MLTIPTQFQSATHTPTSNHQTVKEQAGDRQTGNRQASLFSSKSSPGIQFADRFMQLGQDRNPAPDTLRGTPQENTSEPDSGAGPDNLAELEVAQPETELNAVDALAADEDLPDLAAISVPGSLVAAGRTGPADMIPVSGTGAGTAMQGITELTAQNPGFAAPKQAGQAQPSETGAAPPAGDIDPALIPTPANTGTGGVDKHGVAPDLSAGTTTRNPALHPRGALAASASEQSPALSGNRADPPFSQPAQPAQNAVAGSELPSQAPGLAGNALDRLQPIASLVNDKIAGALPLQGTETGGQTLAGASVSTQSARNTTVGAPVPTGTNGQTPEPLRPQSDALPLGDTKTNATGPEFITDPEGVSATLRDSLQSPLSRLDAAVQINAPGSTEISVARPEAARSVAAQIVEVFVRQPDRPVQISLNPEELGRVRMALSTSETGVIVTIAAERPETLDLMRRHIDLLALEFRRLGFDNIGFEFSGGSADQFSDPDSESPAPTQAPAPPDAETTAPPKRLVSAGLDLRL